MAVPKKKVSKSKKHIKQKFNLSNLILKKDQLQSSYTYCLSHKPHRKHHVCPKCYLDK